MTDDSKKLNLNLNAKEWKPKWQNNQNQQQSSNQFGFFDVNSPYNQMNYANYGNYGNFGYGYGYGNYQQNNVMQPQQSYQNYQKKQNQPQQQTVMTQPQPQMQGEKHGSEIVGLGKQKGKKKKGKDLDPNFYEINPQAKVQNKIPNNQQEQFINYQQNQMINQINQMNITGNNQNSNNYNIQYQNKNDNKKDKKDKKQDKKQEKKGNENQDANHNLKKKENQITSHKEKKEDDIDTEAIKLQSKKVIEGDLVEDSFEGKMINVDLSRKPISLVFVGHVDSGKSTISGSLLYNLGKIDDRTIEKYKREAKIKNRESWFMAYIMDVNDDEREKGKTVEIGKASFETKCKRVTLLDAPGHSGYIPNLLQGACQADVAGLVISAKKGEFEAGFDKQGSTKEHTLLLKALGVTQLIIIVNKMDEDSVKWSQDRYESIKKTLEPFIKSCGYEESNIRYIPISGLYGDNLIKPIDTKLCDWYKGPTLIEILDEITIPERDENAPIRMSILDKYKDNYLYIMGKLESGTLKYGETYILMPNKIKIAVDWLFNSEEKGVPYALPGENVRIRCKGVVNEDAVYRGNILCSLNDLCQIFNVFEAEIQVLELPQNLIIADGFKCMLHYHTFIEECTITPKSEIDRKTKAETKVKFVKKNTRCKAFVKTNAILCGEKFEKLSALGRFSMRFEGMTIAIGKILKIKPYKKNENN